MVGPLGRGPCLRRLYSYRTERVRVENPKPLASNRKSLSEPLKPSIPQLCTLLARLPYEIRLQIWTYALGSKTLHLQLRPGRLGSRICEGSPEGGGQCHALWHWDNFHDDSPMHRKKGAVSLLQACQQIYNETVDLLYATNTIDISDLGVLKYFTQGVPPKRLSLIRDLSVHWQDWSWSPRMPTAHADFGGTWEMFWRIALAELRDLRTINIMMCSAESENRMPDQARYSLTKWREFLEWEFRWEPYANTRCRLVQGKRKDVKKLDNAIPI